MPLRHSPAFSLIEILVAGTMLAVAVLGGSGLTTTCVGSAATLDAQVRCRLAAASTVESVRSLSFAPLSAGASGESGTASAVERLFPHADPALNTSAAFICVSAPGEPARFTSVSQIDGLTLQTDAVFVRSVRTGGWQPLSTGELGSWLVAGDACLPAAALAVTVTATTSSGESASCVLHTLVSAQSPGSDPVEGGGAQ